MCIECAKLAELADAVRAQGGPAQAQAFCQHRAEWAANDAKMPQLHACDAAGGAKDNERLLRSHGNASRATRACSREAGTPAYEGRRKYLYALDTTSQLARLSASRSNAQK